jgi:hypothetical protein
MQRIDTSSKAVDLFGTGKHGYKDGNVSLGTPATQLNASSFNHIQEEISRVIEGAGIALNSESYNQMLTAINTLISNAISPLSGQITAALAIVPDAVSWTDQINLASGTTYDVWANIKSFSIGVPSGKTLLSIASQTYVYIGKTGSSSHAHTIEFRLLVNGQAIGHGFARPDPNTDNDLLWCIPISGQLDGVSGANVTVAIQGRVSSHAGAITTNAGAFTGSNGPVKSEINLLWYN